MQGSARHFVCCAASLQLLVLYMDVSVFFPLQILRRISGTHVGTIGTLETSSSNYGLAINPSRTMMAVASWSDNSVSLYTFPQGSLIRTIGASRNGQFRCPFNVAFYGQNLLVSEDDNKRIQEVTLEGKVVRYIGTGYINDRIYPLIVDGDTIITASANSRLLRIIDYPTGALLRWFDIHVGAGHCFSICLFRDRQCVALGGSGEISVWEFNTGKFIQTVGTPDVHGATSVALDPEGNLLVSDDSPNIRLYSSVTFELLHSFTNPALKSPTCPVLVEHKLYVLNRSAASVEVFE